MGWKMNVKDRNKERGFTIAEFVISAMVATLLLTMMIPATMNLIKQAKEDKVVIDLKAIAEKVDEFRKHNSRYPLSLMEVYTAMPIDPWGNAYQYLNIADDPGHGHGHGNGNGKQRKYKNEKAINEDYDLYSMGSDGKSAPPLTAGPSQDDVIRANNGHFIGIVTEYRQ